jgi:hypothetical protein
VEGPPPLDVVSLARRCPASSCSACYAPAHPNTVGSGIGQLDGVGGHGDVVGVGRDPPKRHDLQDLLAQCRSPCPEPYCSEGHPVALPTSERAGSAARYGMPPARETISGRE